ncbi:hypothetical protein GCM10007094_24070 [Pseudovibrio japonicus]|uniref:Uncharacterized protein n=1 Tax=Pseudovibrio japonicus TaxID=366534 RepID=A0ABQ3EDK7_9HYPH|nr:hypothetical protein [Pseudovibrio japonicus]GHB34172.1 hypothetical protein GCM10007094_24070 [Pseudovibrio japonicus]
MLKKIMTYALLALVTVSLCLAFAIVPSSAQAAEIDLSPILTPVLDVLFPVLGVVLLYFAKRAMNAFEERTNIKLDDQLKERLNEALMNGVMFGKSKVSERVLNRAPTVEVKNEIVGHAVTYALKAVPQAVDYFDLSYERVTELIEARLQQDLNGDGHIGALKS